MTETMLSRRRFTTASLAGIAGAALGAGALSWPVLAAPPEGYAPVPKGDSEFGSYTQSWFLESFYELPDDLAEAQSNGKRLAVLWELDGCPYCREMHLVNFAIPEITDYVRANFEIVQMDLRGSKETVDFDGKEMDEKSLARRHGVRFTPTVQFFPETLDGATGKTGRELEVARMPGYFRPYHFLVMFQYVREKGYESGDFRSYLNARTAALKAEGKSPPNW